MPRKIGEESGELRFERRSGASGRPPFAGLGLTSPARGQNDCRLGGLIVEDGSETAMLRAWLIGLIAVLGACATSSSHIDAKAVAAFAHPSLSAEALMGHVAVLSSDAFEGRAPSTHGEELSIAYIQRAFQAVGLQPGARASDGSRSYFQDVPLTSALVDNAPSFTVTGADGPQSYAWGEQFVCWTKRVQENVSIADAPLVFVGYGVVAPEHHWNDYAGVDMHGKIAVILINDPDAETGDDRGFGGKAMTYYGRWTYKYEEAARQGAAGAIIIHETGPAAYPWSVVRSSNTNTRFDIVHADQGMSRVPVEGWVTSEVGHALFQRAGMSFDQMKARAQTPGFRPVAMGALRGSVSIHTRLSQSLSHNVIGVLPGALHPDQAIIYSAHWDHLGHCTPVNGDGICNGALDNATGVAGLIELARHYAEAGPAQRSVVFIGMTAEEQGLLGSYYYTEHPTFAPGNMVANINMDGLSIYGRAHDLIIVGYGKSQMDDLTAAAVQAQGRRVRPDPFPERGSFFRADQYNFARVGVPVLYTAAGIDLLNGGEARGAALVNDFIAHRYHSPQDEITPDWDMSGASEDLHVLYNVGRGLADGGAWPGWRPDAEFRGAREATHPLGR
jgi:Zn-dependent M28 family amino/carboxypeptidase